MLETELAPCAAAIQIVGHRYGWKVPASATSAPLRFAYSSPLR
jgi:Fe2+ transport system protein B